jgi:tetratricopeptide (TPR) repeat protein
LDYGAVVSLLQRAAATLPTGSIDLRIETTLIEALFWGGDAECALVRSKSLVQHGRAADDRVAVLCGLIKARSFQLSTHPEGAANRLDKTIQRALPVFHQADAKIALFVAYSALAGVKNHRARTQEALAAIEQAITYFPATRGELVGWLANSRILGPTPAADVLAWLDEPEQRQDRSLWLGMTRAIALGMLCQAAEARNVINEVLRTLADRGKSLELALFTGAAAEIELMAGNLGAAAALLRDECEQLQQLGDQSFLSTVSACLAQVLCQLDRLDEADEWVERARTLGASDDVETQYRWRLARAVLLARGGDGEEAQELAREAVRLAETTDNIDYCAGAYASLAEVLDIVGKPDQAADALREALARYEQKGNVVMARRMRERLQGTS